MEHRSTSHRTRHTNTDPSKTLRSLASSSQANEALPEPYVKISSTTERCRLRWTASSTDVLPPMHEARSQTPKLDTASKHAGHTGTHVMLSKSTPTRGQHHTNVSNTTIINANHTDELVSIPPHPHFKGYVAQSMSTFKSPYLRTTMSLENVYLATWQETYSQQSHPAGHPIATAIMQSNCKGNNDTTR